MDLATILSSGLLAVIVNVIGVFWLKERLKQSIKHEYDRDLEQLKKDLEFELDKKKKLYEGKLTQYKKYYAIMDGYSQRSRKALFNSFQTGIIEVIKNPSEENTVNYIQNILALQGDVSDKFLTFKTEINGLRLEAGEELLHLLDQYVEKLEKTQEKTVQFMSWMNQNATNFITDPEATSKHVNDFIQLEFGAEGKELMGLQQSIFKEMRRELGIV